MRTQRIRGMALVVLCAGLMAAPARAAERRAPAPGPLAGAAAAARLWLGGLLGFQVFGEGTGGAGRLVAVAGADEQLEEEGGTPPAPAVAGIFKLKAHVDNPGQTP